MSLIARYILAGDLLDSSGNGHDLAANGGTPSYVTGPQGQTDGAFEFDGIVALAAPAAVIVSGNGPLTLACWVRFDTETADRKVVTIGNGSVSGGAVSLTTEGGLRWRHGGGNVTFDAPDGTGSWAHVAVVVPDVASATTDDGVCYVDGVPAAVTRTGGSDRTVDIATGYPLEIGAYFGVNTRGNGAVADVRLYDHALTAAEIDEIINPVTSRRRRNNGLNNQLVT